MENILGAITAASIIDYAISVIGALVLLFAAWIAAGWFGRATSRTLAKTEMDETLTKFFGNVVKYGVLILAILACLGIFGVETTSFAAVFAAAGFAIGLAFQGTLSNFSAGVMLLTFRPFKVGDVISAAGVVGKVNEIELFTTKLDTPDNRRIIIPNSALFGSTIENITFHDTRRVDVVLGTDYSADLDQTREVLEGVLSAEEAVLPEQGTQVVLTDLGDSSINWQLRLWVKTEDYWAVKERITRAAKIALDEAGIGIPFPQMDVHLDGSLDSKS